jgi:hypothetical protein
MVSAVNTSSELAARGGITSIGEALSEVLREINQGIDEQGQQNQDNTETQGESEVAICTQSPYFKLEKPVPYDRATNHLSKQLGQNYV